MIFCFSTDFRARGTVASVSRRTAVAASGAPIGQKSSELSHFECVDTKYIYFSRHGDRYARATAVRKYYINNTIYAAARFSDDRRDIASRTIHNYYTGTRSIYVYVYMYNNNTGSRRPIIFGRFVIAQTRAIVRPSSISTASRV